MPASSSSSPARFDGRRETQPALVGDERGGEPLSRRELGGCGAHPRTPTRSPRRSCRRRRGRRGSPARRRLRPARGRRPRSRSPSAAAEAAGPRAAARAGTPSAAAAASAPATDTARTAFAPSRLRSGVPSSAAQGRVEARLVGGVPAGHVRRDRLVHGRNGEPDASAAVALAAVPELAGLVAAGGRAGRHGRDAAHARGDANLARDRRRAAGVERLPREHGGDTRRAHLSASPSASQAASTVAGGSSRKRVATRARQQALALRQVLGRRLAVDAGEHEAARVEDDVGGIRRQLTADLRAVGIPEGGGARARSARTRPAGGSPSASGG